MIIETVGNRQSKIKKRILVFSVNQTLTYICNRDKLAKDMLFVQKDKIDQDTSNINL
jgi:hypothetical protein